MIIKTVTIPACVEHWGMYSKNVTVNWVCPVCGQYAITCRSWWAGEECVETVEYHEVGE